jgi:bifunctional DNA-binding transcriptional regulator/antitoxin component of YhaV-PrlF toxin-antitoxin module
METKVRVGEAGEMTFPAEVVERYRIEPGDTLELLDLGGVFVLVQPRPNITELALEIEAALNEAGITMDEMFAGLREERKRYVAEKYGIRE